MGISGIPHSNPDWKNVEQTVGSAFVSFEVHTKDVKVRKRKIDDVARGLAEIAFNLGETNDTEFYADEMAETLRRAFKKASDRLKRDRENRDKG